MRRNDVNVQPYRIKLLMESSIPQSILERISQSLAPIQRFHELRWGTSPEIEPRSANLANTSRTLSKHRNRTFAFAPRASVATARTITPKKLQMGLRRLIWS